VGELLAIRWADLDLDNERLTINQSLSQTREGGWFFKSPKNKSSRRTITLPTALVDALREHRERQQRIRDLFGPDYPSMILSFRCLTAHRGRRIALLMRTSRLHGGSAQKAFDFTTYGTHMLLNC
jgi:integrase